jgi:hypothetical protein
VALPAREGGDRVNAAEFNARYRVGTPVVAYPLTRPEDDQPEFFRRLVTRTRTPAWTLGHGGPVVSVDGYAGGIDLAHVDPFGPLDSSPEAHAARNTPRNPHPLCRDFQPQPRPADFWCATCHWNRPMHGDEAKRSAIAEALKCLPETTKRAADPTTEGEAR